jgi:KUP system potassium uptake protein
MMADLDMGPGAQPWRVRADDDIDDSELDIADYLKDEGDEPPPPVPQGFVALTLGAVGVVYGDIGTSPIYAFREAVHVAGREGGVTEAEVLGLLSLLIWTLVLIVTVKYIMVLLRADNRGEGGVLALYALARLALGRRSIPVLLLALAGAALFAGDAMITPAISILSAVEGVKLITPALEPWVLPISVVIISVLFAVQRRGTAAVAFVFGPVTALWFLALGTLGVLAMIDNPSVLRAFSPVWAVTFLVEHRAISFIVLGAVFLAVTGAEALYADLGHFGRKPIVAAWTLLVFPALVLNYLGQGALVLADPAALEDPFFHLAGPTLLPGLVLLATAATVIASQAVISGAFSLGRQAIQLGMLPRMRIRHTSPGQQGQIYVGAINWMLMFGVLVLVLEFRSSSALAAAYGIAVTGTMIITTALLVIWAVAAGRLPAWQVALLALPIVVIEGAFLASNLWKITEGGWAPITVAGLCMLLMWAWWRGTQSILARIHRTQISLRPFADKMLTSSVHIVPGTAIFLTPDADAVPSALLHNLKHNRVLHEKNVILTVETLRVPLAAEDERMEIEVLNDRFTQLTLRYGFMESPNVSRGLARARKLGLRFDVMSTTFFVGRRRPVPSGTGRIDRALDTIYAILHRFSADPSDYYHLPRDRMVELGERVAV